MSKRIYEYAEVIESVRTNVGLNLGSDLEFVRFTGGDAASWLHSQTTNDVEGLASGDGHHNAVLDRQGRLQGHFTLHRWLDEYWMLIDCFQVDAVLEHLEAHLFIEDVQIERAGDSIDQLILQGPKSLPFLASIMDDETALGSALLPQVWYGVHPVEIGGIEVIAFRISTTGEDGYVFAGEPADCEALKELLCAQVDLNEIPMLIGTRESEQLRIEAGLPRFGTDMDAKCRIPETTLERSAISYEKGCYLGQEVVARLKAYGTVKQALMGLVFEAKDVDSWEPGESLLVDDKSIGRGMSMTYSTGMEKTIALAYLDRDHRTPGSVVSFRTEHSDQLMSAEVRVLPFYTAPTREEAADVLYHEALDLFEEDVDDSDGTAIDLLREAILLAPEFEDAYEVLGVILHRHQRVDEAIYFMNRLKDLNPKCVMAHTNLSVFYLAKGMIEEAEVAKAQSAVLQIEHAGDERRAADLAADERKQIQKEAQERIGMFIEVLDLDGDDPVATFGLGKAYMQLGDYGEAAPHLLRATEVQKDFSAAFLDLGKCYEFLDRTEDAVDIFEKGIVIASRKGDLIPMREMERRLSALTRQETSGS